MKSQSFLGIKKKNKKLHEAALEADFADSTLASFSEKLEKIKQRRKIYTIAAVLLAIAGVTLFAFRRDIHVSNAQSVKEVAQEIANDQEQQENVFVNDGAPEIKAVEEEVVILEQSSFYQSENYKARAVSFGESANAFTSSDEGVGIKIIDVRSETVMSRSGDEAKVVISWKTNKLAKSELIYDNVGSGEKKIKEDGFGYSHAAILSKLETGQRYTYAIKANDRWGNSTSSEQFSVFVGSKPSSIFQLISKEFDSMFGWAIEK
ncbi:MAG: hypothetical protein ACD_9C00251G0005 [uncultured bacterium]|nr:MAG: hypothetical protein ACD_9C00251G0005 [uncultured bacterium]